LFGFRQRGALINYNYFDSLFVTFTVIVHLLPALASVGCWSDALHGDIPIVGGAQKHFTKLTDMTVCSKHVISITIVLI